jgi:hypothetical protein
VKRLNLIVLVGICFVVTLFIRLQVGEMIRSFFQDGQVELTSTSTGAQVLIDGKEGDVLQRKVSFGLYQSTISDGDKVVLVVLEPPDWIGVWASHTERLSNGKQSKPAVSEINISRDLRSEILIEHIFKP